MKTTKEELLATMEQALAEMSEEKEQILVLMPTLDQHNEGRKALSRPGAPPPTRMQVQAPPQTGIRCPKCDPPQEMVWVDYSRSLPTHPPQRSVRCPKCWHRGYMTC